VYHSFLREVFVLHDVLDAVVTDAVVHQHGSKGCAMNDECQHLLLVHALCVEEERKTGVDGVVVPVVRALVHMIHEVLEHDGLHGAPDGLERPDKYKWTRMSDRM
jgi:hypothetical protein